MTEPVVVVPLHVAAWLHRRLPHGLAVLVAGRDPALDRVLAAFRSAAVVQAQLDLQRGTAPSQRGEPAPRSVTTGPAAARLGITRRGVRQAINRGRLPAQEVDGRWQIDTTDLDDYAAHRHERSTA